MFDCYNDDSQRLKSWAGNLCVEECNEGEINKNNSCINYITLNKLKKFNNLRGFQY